MKLLYTAILMFVAGYVACNCVLHYNNYHDRIDNYLYTYNAQYKQGYDNGFDDGHP